MDIPTYCIRSCWIRVGLMPPTWVTHFPNTSATSHTIHSLPKVIINIQRTEILFKKKNKSNLVPINWIFCKNLFFFFKKKNSFTRNARFQSNANSCANTTDNHRTTTCRNRSTATRPNCTSISCHRLFAAIPFLASRVPCEKSIPAIRSGEFTWRCQWPNHPSHSTIEYGTNDAIDERRSHEHLKTIACIVEAIIFESTIIGAQYIRESQHIDRCAIDPRLRRFRRWTNWRGEISVCANSPTKSN